MNLSGRPGETVLDLGNHPLAYISDRVHSVADAVRWACVLEATSPKAGNVFPGKSFSDLTYLDFMKAAEIAADAFSDSKSRFSQMVLTAVKATRDQVGSNVNLGILLLIGPLAELAHRGDFTGHAESASPVDCGAWIEQVAGLLRQQTSEDAAAIFQAIRLSAAGGLGEVDKMDVNQTGGAAVELDLVDAMKLSADRDAIAKQYATNYRDLLQRVVPIVDWAIRKSGDVLGGIAIAHIELLRDQPDSLIARKAGIDMAQKMQLHAKNVDIRDCQSVEFFDQTLRADGNRLNPGTTADLIAASLFLILVDRFSRNQCLKSSGIGNPNRS